MSLNDAEQADVLKDVQDGRSHVSNKNTKASVPLDRAIGKLKATAPPPPPPPPPPPNGGAIPTSWDEQLSDPAALDKGGSSGQWRDSTGYTLTQKTVAGKDWVEIRENGSGHTDGCFCPRVKFEGGFALGQGDEVWQHGEYLFPDPQKINPSFSRIMSLNCYPGTSGSWYLALETNGQGKMQVSYAPYGDPHTVVIPALLIPVNVAFKVDLHYKLGGTDGACLTDLYLDGVKLASSTKRNMFKPSDGLNIAQFGRPYACNNSEPGAVVLFRDPRLKIV